MAESETAAEKIASHTQTQQKSSIGASKSHVYCACRAKINTVREEQRDFPKGSPGPSHKAQAPEVMDSRHGTLYHQPVSNSPDRSSLIIFAAAENVVPSSCCLPRQKIKSSTTSSLPLKWDKQEAPQSVTQIAAWLAAASPLTVPVNLPLR